MRTLKKVVSAEVGHISELPDEDQVLLQYAALARKNAQAPYSNYFVGVAVRNEEGHFFWGCNVERASYTQTTHAEQNAIDTMVCRKGPSKVTAVGLVAAPANVSVSLCDEPSAENQIKSIEQVPVPCGHCLQIIWENCFNDPDVQLIAAVNGEVVVTTIGDALPMRFGPKELGVDYSKIAK